MALECGGVNPAYTLYLRQLQPSVFQCQPLHPVGRAKIDLYARVLALTFDIDYPAQPEFGMAHVHADTPQ